MKELLIYLEEVEDREEVERLFLQPGFVVTLVEQEAQFLPACRRGLYDVVLLWRTRPERVAAFCNLLQEHQMEYLPLLPVVAEEVLAREILSHPVADVLVIPQPRFEFFQLLDQIIQELSPLHQGSGDAAFRGNLADFSLIDLIQVIEQRKLSGRVRLDALGFQGIVFFNQGRITHAQLESLEGLPALEKLAFLKEGYFQIRLMGAGGLGGERSIQKASLLEHLKGQQTQWEKQYSGLPDQKTEMLANPLRPPKGGSGLDEEIYRFFQTPHRLGEVLLKLPDPVDQIIAGLHRQVRNGQLGLREEVEKRVAEEEKKGGLGRVVGGLTTLFKRKEEPPPPSPPPPASTAEKSSLPPRIVPSSIHVTDREAIEKLLEEAQK